MRIFRLLPHFGMSARQEQRIRVANFGLDQAQIVGCIEQAGIPAFPVWQQYFDLFSQIHCCNVYELNVADNDGRHCFLNESDVGEKRFGRELGGRSVLEQFTDHTYGEHCHNTEYHRWTTR